MRPVLLALTLLSLPSASAAQRWISVTSPHFQLYTSAPQEEAIAAAQTFEQIYYFFSQGFTLAVKLDTRVHILAFNSEEEFKPYRPNDGTFAFYESTPMGDFIALQDIRREHSESVLHEYTHLVIRHAALQLPLWLSEGMADLYSTLEPFRNNTVLLGKPPAKAAEITPQRWMDWNTLLTTGQDSPFYNERNKMSVFYAQSWLLTHMLNCSPEYAPQFGSFLNAVSLGATSQQALRKVYGKGVAALDQDVRRYLSSPLRSVVLPAQVPRVAAHIDVEPIDDFHLDLVLAEARLFSPDGVEDGLARLQALEREHPEVSEIHQTLGYFLLNRQERPAARSEFLLASQAGSRDPRLYYFLGELQNELHDPASDVIDSLQKAVELDPNNNQARLLLGELYSNNDRYSAAIETLAVMRNVPPAQAFPWFAIRAYCYAQLNALDQAQLFIEKALAAARSDDQREQMQGLARFVHYQLSKAK